jgi:hypothetical protein
LYSATWRKITLTSLINFAAINENFPVAGQDNDTQVFRDNFDTIKNNFREAKTEIEDLQNNSARTDATSDFNYSVVTTVTLQDAVLIKKDYGAASAIPSTQEVSFKEALYHIIKFGANCAIELVDFPTAEIDVEGIGSCGKITLELYGDGTARTISFTPTGSQGWRKNSSVSWVGTSSVPAIVVTHATNPLILEVWQHDANTIFLNYLGQFS